MNSKQPHPPVPSTPEKRSTSLVRQCLAVAATASMAAACAGAQVRPEAQDCPAKVIAAMEKKGIQRNKGLLIYFDATDYERFEREIRATRWIKPYKIYENGPVVGRVIDPMESGVPNGTLLYGYIWVDADPEYAVVRYHEALYPNGTKVPVCMFVASGWGTDGFLNGIQKGEHSKHNLALLFPRIGAVFVERYPSKIGQPVWP